MSSTRKLSNKIKADSPARSNKITIETKSTNSTESIIPTTSTITTPTAAETLTTKILNEKSSEESNGTIDFYLNKITTNLTNSSSSQNSSEKDNNISNTETGKINTTNTTTVTDTTASSSIQSIDTKNETNTFTTQTARTPSPVLRTMMDYFPKAQNRKKVMPKRDKLPRKATTSPDSKDIIDHLTRGLVVPGKRKREDSICSDKSDRKNKNSS